MGKYCMINCAICGNELNFTPRLGEWMAHKLCRDSVAAFIKETERRSWRIERDRIVSWIREESGTRRVGSGSTMRWIADAIESGEHYD